MAQASNDVATAAPVDVKLADIMNCPVCSRLLSDAKLLPCSHSCCMKCLESLTTEQDAGESDGNPLLDKEYRQQQQQQHLQHYHPCISSCSPYHQIYSPADTTAMTKMAVVNSRPACALADDGHRLLEAATTETTTSTLHSDGYQLSNQVTCSAAPDDPDVTRVQTAQA